MPSQVLTTTESNFTKGLVTEFTGLNFPENAATDASDTEFTLVGDVTRRLGINYEVNHTTNPVGRSSSAVSTYKWNNVGGDGETQVVVEQIGGTLYFYRSSTTTVSNPLSSQLLGTTVNINNFLASGGTFDPTEECQFTDGNGYLFVYHPSCDPFYCTYTNGIVSGSVIPVQIRDFVGVPDNLAVTNRPSSLTPEHNYNLTNQGWTSGSGWTAASNTRVQIPGAGGTATFTVAPGLPIAGGDTVVAYCYDPISFQPPYSNVPGTVGFTGVVSSYVSGTGTLSITITGGQAGLTIGGFTPWGFYQQNLGHINTWLADIGNYPSNADVWWYFKDNTNIFNPTTTVANISLSNVQAPQGHYILSAFNQNKTVASSIVGLTSITTTARPRTGTWFQGRVWFTGVDAQQPATGDAPYYTWTESIYFSQVVQTPSDFGSCYQVNDPTSENLFDLLPTDGGVIQIQGSGSVYKLFPIQNGMLVFAANGVWFITGSQGIGFSANDYTITKISNVRSISSTSFVNVNGLPYFWNEEGIYAVEPQQGGGLAVNPLTVGTILSYYNDIPYTSKVYAHGDYDPINYVIQWVFKSTIETSVTDRYTYDTILNFNTYNKAFFPYSPDITSGNSINGIIYVSSPGGTNAPDPVLKYVASTLTATSFAEEYDPALVDWGSVNYISTFTTGYKLHGQGLRRFQLSYLYVYSRGGPTSYKIQGLWDYATSGNSGRWSVAQLVNNWNPNFGMIFRRHKIRGQGLVLQLKFTSVDGQPFDIMGWSAFENQNTGV